MVMMMPSSILRRIRKTEVQGGLRSGASFREVHASMEERNGGGRRKMCSYLHAVYIY